MNKKQGNILLVVAIVLSALMVIPTAIVGAIDIGRPWGADVEAVAFIILVEIAISVLLIGGALFIRAGTKEKDQE